MYDEDVYLRALAEMSNRHFDEKEWLIDNFELYKMTLVWPPNMPPINRPGLIKGTLREKFNSTFRSVLSEFEYDFNNKDQTLIFK